MVTQKHISWGWTEGWNCSHPWLHYLLSNKIIYSFKLVQPLPNICLLFKTEIMLFSLNSNSMQIFLVSSIGMFVKSESISNDTVNNKPEFCRMMWLTNSNSLVIILHNLANWVTFVFSLHIEHWCVKEHFSPRGHLWKSSKVTWQLTALSMVTEN